MRRGDTGDDRERAQAVKFKKELLSGTTSLVLLGLVERAPTPLHGYAIAREVDLLCGDGLSIRGGALYPALRTLERQGLLRSVVEPSPGGPPRKVYRVTPAGRRALRARLATWRAASELVEGACVDERARRGLPRTSA